MSFSTSAEGSKYGWAGLCCALALGISLVLTSGGCRQQEGAEEAGFPATNLAVDEHVSAARALVFVTGGRLRMLQQDRPLRALSGRGSEQVPVGVFDISASAGEAVLAHGGSVGVVPLEKPVDGADGSAGEEWYDLRALAGDDFYVSLVGFVPPGRKILAGGYRASVLDEGFQLLSVDRDTGKTARVDVPAGQRRLVLRDLRFSPGGSAYLHLVDETVPSDYVYRVADGELALILDTEKLLGRGTGEDYEVAAGDLHGLVALSLVDFMALREDLYLVVYMLSNNGEDSDDNLTERCEVWRFNRESLAISKRYNLANPRPGELMDMYFTMGADGIYFARLSLVDEAPDARPSELSLLRLDTATGEVVELFNSELPSDFYGLAIFPEADACAVLYGTEGQLRVDGVTLAGEKFQAGISVERPDVRYLPAG
ncbi:hypothetical protein J7J84_02105 [bacterium]|nr:hypothetical protein [bacterium]